MIILWCIAGVLMSLGTIFIILNWVMLFETWRTGRFHSCVAIIGAGFFCVGSLPLPATRPYAWLAFLDVGTVLFVCGIPLIVADLWRNRFGLLEVLIGEQANQSIMIRLLQKSRCVIYQFVRRPPSDRDILQRVMVGTWSRDEHRLIVRVGDKSTVFEWVAEATPETWRLASGAELFDDNVDFAVSSLDLKLNYRLPSK